MNTPILNIKFYIKILAAVITYILSANITFHLGEIPITGQTLAILSWACFLMPLEAGLSVMCYLILGAVGLPVFADGAAGLSVLMGNTGGYLVGFLMASVSTSFMVSNNKNVKRIFVAHTIGTMVILGLGTARLTMLKGLDVALNYGLSPFIVPGLIKIVIGTLICIAVVKINPRLSHQR